MPQPSLTVQVFKLLFKINFRNGYSTPNCDKRQLGKYHCFCDFMKNSNGITLPISSLQKQFHINELKLETDRYLY